MRDIARGCGFGLALGLVLAIVSCAGGSSPL